MNRRSALRAVTLGAAATLLGSCAPIQAPSAPSAPSATPSGVGASMVAQPTAGSGSTSTDTPRRGGVLRSVVIGDINGLEPHILVTTTTETLWMVCDRLTMYDDQLVPQPQLAESWETSADATQLKLNLRKGVQFHNGREHPTPSWRSRRARCADSRPGPLAVSM
jgi:peptide/nickel transport system substrate-binding protein